MFYKGDFGNQNHIMFPITQATILFDTDLLVIFNLKKTRRESFCFSIAVPF